MPRLSDAGGGGLTRRARTPAPRTLPGGATTLIARIWRGQTPAAVADEYSKYLRREGVRAIARIPGNRGVQMLRSVGDEVADFQVLSYWDSIEAIKRFAGEDYEQVHHLRDDPKYMVGAAPTVRHFEVVVNDWPQQ
jgi:heme-degrading monooxygenase HmoA